jgi:hypothetical protein
MTTSREQLEEIAGGKDALVAALLELRTDDSTPFVAVRAEKILIGYADRDDVAQALTSDINSTQYAGLARTVSIHVNDAPTSTARVALGRQLLERAGKDSSFLPYARALEDSTEPELRNAARSLPK